MKPTLVIFGLGNPGKEYDGTRHNVGFAAVDYLSDTFGQGDWQDKQKFLGDIQEARIGVAPVLLVKPKTYMNLSGDSVRKVVDFYKLDASKQILIVSDDVDLPLGEVRYRESGGPGTHNGLKSIAESFGEEFSRIRIGLGEPPAGSDLSNWVLSRFSSGERDVVSESFVSLGETIKSLVLGE